MCFIVLEKLDSIGTGCIGEVGLYCESCISSDCFGDIGLHWIWLYWSSWIVFWNVGL